ncbi:LD-carboxypeptidase [Derxia gummosa]|uniref:LD-carboxypeptidase n=1 Tax=Derxia gummosa DSM 723 TaxID=1121388 RepID=A0A8B6X3M2_9BURK|nr:LD-carboxypeptidase [Derxia gummosa]
MPIAEIVAPSGQVLDPPALDRAIAHLRARGYAVREAPQLRACVERFAGTDDARAAALEAALLAPDADLVIAARGGYGLSRLMTRIDWARVAAAMRERGTVFVGHSDITAAQLALLAVGAPSLAGPMACYDLGAETRSGFTETHFWGLLAADEHRVRIGRAALPGEPAVALEGLLWGGNLSLVASLVGTPWLPAIQGGLLFLEDVAEHPYRVERMLSQLLHAGVLGRQRAILLGGFTDYRLFPNDNGYDMPSVVAWLRANCTTPVVTGLPFGHTRDKLTLPVGGRCRLKADETRIDLLMANPLPRRLPTRA